MRDRIGKTFEAARGEGRAALVVYTTAGYPSPEQGLDALEAIADAGADVIELGVPFSDPLADGPTIQRSSFEALAAGVDLPIVVVVNPDGRNDLSILRTKSQIFDDQPGNDR